MSGPQPVDQAIDVGLDSPVALPEPGMDAAWPPAAETAPTAELAEASEDAAADTTAGEVIADPLPAAPKPLRPRSVVWPALLGGVLAAGIGAGAALYLLPGGWTPGATQPVADIEAQSARIAAIEAELASLKSSGASAAFVTSSVRDLSQRLGAAEKALRAEIKAAAEASTAFQAAFETRLNEIEMRPLAGGETSASAMAAFDREMAATRTLLEEYRTASDAAGQAIAAAAADAQAQIAAAGAEAEERALAAETAAQKATARAAFSHLQAAFSSDAPLGPALDALTVAEITLAPELVDSVTAAPSLTDLKDRFPAAARAALTASLRAESENAGTMQRIGAFLRSQTGARSLEPREGDGPDAVLSRAEAKLQSGDVAAAIEELTALPEPGRAAMAGWIVEAEARLSALSAIADLASTLN